MLFLHQLVDQLLEVGVGERAEIDAGLGQALFWWSLGVSLLVAFVFAFPLNRWLISRGRGHAVIHDYHGH